MTVNLYEAHQQWASRPADERFSTLENLALHVRARRNSSREEVVNIRDLHIAIEGEQGIGLNHHHPTALFTHWAFGQLCTTVGAPARYLRTLPAELAGDCLRQGISKSSEKCRLLYRNFDEGLSGDGSLKTAAFTGPTYGRIWDSDVIEALGEVVSGSGWHVPESKHSLPSGLYASDRDVFAFMVSDEPPIEIGNAKLGRGFFIWNSETGASTFGLTTFLYNYVCGNHIVWGAEEVNELRIVHREKAPDRYYREAIPILSRFVENRSVSDSVSKVVYRAMREKTGESIEDVLKWFEPKSFTKREVTEAFTIGQSEGDDPTTVWGMVQGLTAYARTFKFTDSKVDLERRAGLLLALN